VLAPRPIGIRPSSFLGLALLLGACFDPDPTPLETESAGTTDDSTAGTVCDPGEEQTCTCGDGSAGIQLCSADGSGFGACGCEAVDSTVSTEPTTTTEPPPECESADDCNEAAGMECQIDACVDGVCTVEHEPDGTACGSSSETECDAPDSCSRGQCSPNEAPTGTSCTECESGVCSCAGGLCGDCDELALQNDFITTRSIDGWTLSGGWGLYRQAPQSFEAGPTVFSGQVLGTDGNRSVPYPGSDNENSAARSRAFVLPATLEFLSWNEDEGSGADTKQVRVSNDGGASFVTLVDCNANPGAQPFCMFRINRAPDDWDAIAIPVPGDMVGDLGVVEFTYVTGDGCCGFEKGWYIDVANIATECACVDDAGCTGLGGECGAAVCGSGGECALDAVAAGQACGDATDVECNAPDACDGLGYCAPNEAVSGFTSCEDCPAGAGNCNVCQAGECVDCGAQPASNDFNTGAGAIMGWVIEDLSGGGADWQVVTSAPLNQMAGSMPVPLSFAPSFGTDGNRQAPYPGAEIEHSRVTTTPDTVPAQISFSSWNVDEGGGTYDTKIIELSVDGGVTWNVLVDCGTGFNVQAFCDFRDDTRAGTDWDEIVLDTAAFAGQVGQLRFTYNTGDSCCEFERGWYIDNLSFAQYCSDSPFP
jgi:hypothetical protein